MTLYDFVVKDYLGKEVSLKKYEGKVLLIVNTATKCGFTPQYDGFEALYAKYKERGFEILDFPCNQFLMQAPGTAEEIHDACVLRFAIAFDQFDKIDVNGKNEHPLYRYLKDNCPVDTGKRIPWNFSKFLVDRKGNIVNRFNHSVTPEEIDKYIVELL